ncbi:uncharacterized protein B0H18DRAFT_1112620 [Fomitopsis serialis]|uniref:uncharacterized protein n=1 Tax=Fomitopsis serialis TaxID=139415 RepID=UPI002008B6D6|nr:uncharacterized protein B0H18DRAFT_1112620 [Neoantrodia serialis]KAH9938465.1 hypothetical protein B0H18DRAFT_1112620 [Neoantrodia serialis]
MAKKGPPYENDPECKYVVIEDPFPGHRTGKARDTMYWEWLSSWVYYMTGKKTNPTAIHYMHTRDEVVVQLPEEADIYPILGVHVWREVLSWGGAKDRDRVSYVFEFNYRKQGHPEEPWTTGGEQDPTRFPVKYPYPRPHWAIVHGRNCADLALPLPKTRARTPTPPPPEPSAFEPYEAPPHLAHVRNAQLDEDIHPPEEQRHREEQHVEPTTGVSLLGQLSVDKRDPYEEEDAALQLVKQEPSDVPISVKPEPSEVVLKQEHNDTQEPQPSEAFLAAFTRLSERTRAGQEPIAKREPSPAPEPQPSQAFLAAFERLERQRAQGLSVVPGAPGGRDPIHIQTQFTPTPERARSETAATIPSSPERARSETWTPGLGARVKPEPQEDALPPPPPSEACNRSRDPRLTPGNSRVKPQEPRLPPPTRPTGHGAIRVKPEPQDSAMPPPAHGNPSDDVQIQDPRQRGKRQ